MFACHWLWQINKKPRTAGRKKNFQLGKKCFPLFLKKTDKTFLIKLFLKKTDKTFLKKLFLKKTDKTFLIKLFLGMSQRNETNEEGKEVRNIHFRRRLNI